MKEIKFRAWIKSERKMTKVHSLHLNTNKAIISYSGGGNYSIKFNEIELMQYTGLKDKNDKEIYEGDILKYDWDGKTVIDFIEYKGNMFTYHNSVRWNLQADEVIGNIYENLELIAQ